MTTPKSKKSDYLSPAPADYKWPRCPEPDQFVENFLKEFLSSHSFAGRLARQMMEQTSTRFSAWVDHLIVPARNYDAKEFAHLGFVEYKKGRCPSGAIAFWHPYADLPKILVDSKSKEIGCAIKVDNLWQFQLAQGLSVPIEGAPYSFYRRIKLMEAGSHLLVVERRGCQDFIPDEKNRSATYLRNFEKWATRPRFEESPVQLMKQTLQLAREMVRDLGTGTAATIFLEAERVFWQKRNRAGQVQKSRQDELGLGWANHDHHTFRSSRSHFPMLINILLELGFKKRERYYAGAQAGWGAQIMEQPEAGLVIFADVDLRSEDLTVDFSKVAMPELKKPGTIGLWCAMHGESMLEAGMHHLEAKFDYEKMRDDMKLNQVDVMPPFSDFPFLRQAFTKAEMWPVAESRLNVLRGSGALSEEAYQQIKSKGAVGSHLENLQRQEGFKGFNQRGVSEIITAVNPEKQALARSKETGA